MAPLGGSVMLALAWLPLPLFKLAAARSPTVTRWFFTHRAPPETRSHQLTLTRALISECVQWALFRAEQGRTGPGLPPGRVARSGHLIPAVVLLSRPARTQPACRPGPGLTAGAWLYQAGTTRCIELTRFILRSAFC